MTALILDKLLYTGILELKDSSMRLEGRKMESAEFIVTTRNITENHCDDDILSDIILYILLLWSDSERRLDWDALVCGRQWTGTQSGENKLTLLCFMWIKNDSSDIICLEENCNKFCNMTCLKIERGKPDFSHQNWHVDSGVFISL